MGDEVRNVGARNYILQRYGKYRCPKGKIIKRYVNCGVYNVDELRKRIKAIDDLNGWRIYDRMEKKHIYPGGEEK